MPRQAQGERRQLDSAGQARAQAHLHLVEVLAWEQFRRCGQTVPLQELVGEAQLALAYGATLYDDSEGVPFGAYATMVIRHWLVQAVTLWRRGGRLDHARFSDLIPLDPGGENLFFDPPCPRTREPGDEAADREVLDRVRRALPPRWFVVLELYFVQEHTLEEIGRQLGISRERVRQLLVKAIRRARGHFSAEVGEGPARRD